MPFTLYNANWPDGYKENPLSVEMECIRKGGKWVNSKGVNCGNGLFFHYMAMRKLLWPHLDNHRWSDLCAREVLNNKVTVLLGCGSSGKTHSCWIYLCEYFCFPEETCVLVSSTDMRGLRMRVWGELSGLWQQAIDRFPDLPGNMLDSRLAITTDTLDEEEFDKKRVRDMRKGIIGIPTVTNGQFTGLQKWLGIKQKRVRLIADEACFPAGTLVNTPSGLRPIESIRKGDAVLNAAGVSYVKRTGKFKRDRIVRIKSSKGDIVATESHPFFTQFGWKKACELNQTHYMVSGYEAMLILQSSIPTHKQQQGLSRVSGESHLRNLLELRSTVQKGQPEFDQEVLRSILLREMDDGAAGLSGEVLHGCQGHENCSVQAANAFGPPGIRRSVSSAKHQFSRDAQSRVSGEDHPSIEGNWSQAEGSRRQWNRADDCGIKVEGACPGVAVEFSGYNRTESGIGVSNLLQIGLRDTGIEIGGGSGREFSSDAISTFSGRQENQISNGAWVDGCEVVEQADFERFGGGPGGIDVYNLEVEDHPSFCVNGVLVHNSMMGSSFLSAFSNLNKNADFQAIVLGNPSDLMDPLGKAAEPIDGWNAHLNPSKTSVWKTRFMNGTCVNLVGTDSPNNDFPPIPPRYPYLINQLKIQETLSFFSKDSPEYYSQCVGVMKIGLIAKRVLTLDMVRQFDAQGNVKWKTDKQTKIYALDAAYGGDRCVGGAAEFGEDMDGNIVLAFEEPHIIPISVDGGEPEYQIARRMREECEARGIPPENVFHDSTGRGSLGTALAREWSARTNPVEFGGRPTDRPVSLDMYVKDQATGESRLKRCDEHYDRFVSEMWFSVRYAVESAQIKRLPEEAKEELCLRSWDDKNGKKCVEPKNGTATKPGMKQRTGRSPDYGDWAATIVEGARRLGFQISRLAAEPAKGKEDDWFDLEAKKYQKAIDANLLNHK